MTRQFTDEDATWLREYVSGIDSDLRARLQAHAARFADWERLANRIGAARDAVLANGWAQFHVIDEAHNEALVGVAILESTDKAVERLEYEPKLTGTPQSIDFCIHLKGQSPCFLDVKTIAPVTRDRWDQFAQAEKEGWLPDNATVTLDKEWLGGEIWHSMVTARSRMLEYTLELEAKVSAAGLNALTDCIALIFCSNGFH